MVDRALSIVASIVVVAGITTLVMSGRNTAGVIRESGNAFSKSLNAALGRG